MMEPHSAAPVPLPPEPGAPFRSLRGHTVAVVVLIGGLVVLSLVGATSDAITEADNYADAIRNVHSGEKEARGFLETTLVVAGAAGIAVALWARRLTMNNAALGARGRVGPNAATFSWFVPVWNLWGPYQALGDAWRIADPEGAEAGWWRGSPAGLVLWEVAWIGFQLSGACVVVGLFIFATDLSYNYEPGAAFGRIGLVGIVLTAPAMGAAAVILARRQHGAARARGLGQ